MGVEKQLLKAGNGPKPAAGQSVTVHCTGFGKNGDLSKKFWSTKDPGQKPFTFKIGQGSVIKGWDEGVMDMQVGEVARLQKFSGEIHHLHKPVPTKVGSATRIFSPSRYIKNLVPLWWELAFDDDDDLHPLVGLLGVKCFRSRR